MELTVEITVMLICSGLLVGFINTLAGGAAIFSITLFTILGMPLSVANGTNRIPVLLQNLTSSITFMRKKILDVRLGIKLAVPSIVGNVLGSKVAVTIDESIFRICLGVVLLAVLAMMVFSSEKRLANGSNPQSKVVVKPLHYIWFLLIGFYGGYIYVGMGYLILGVALMSMNVDLVTANALKGFVALMSAPFALVVFMLNGHVYYEIGLVHALGNIIGAYIASQYAVGWGTRFLRLFVIAMIVVCGADIFGFISLKGVFYSVLN